MNNSDNEMGPFGRSFIGDFPTLGTMLILLSTFFISALFSLGNLIPFLILFIISSSSVVYISYNLIEPHFNSKPLNFIKKSTIKIKENLSFTETSRPTHIISFQDSIRSFFINWSDFNGRSSRSEHNWILLFSFIVNILFYLIGIFLGIILYFSNESPSLFSLILLIIVFLLSTIVLLASVFLLIPTISLTIRRIHDIGFSGWYLLLFILVGAITYYLSPYIFLIYIIPFYTWLIFSSGERKYNKFGHVPSNKLNNKKVKSLKQIWDFSGNNFSNLFNFEINFQSSSVRKGPMIGTWNPETKFRSWLILGIIWFTSYISLYIAAFLPYIFIIFSDIQSLDFYFTMSLFLQWSLTALLISIIFYFEDKFSYLRELFKIPKLKQSSILIPLILILDFILITIYLLIYDFIAGAPNDTSYDEISTSTYGLVLLFVAMAIAAPIFEEILFRGYILDKIRNLYSDKFAIISSGFLFGLMHWEILAPLDFAQTGAATIGGFLYAWLRIKTGSLWPSIICHALWNGGIFFLVFI